MDDLTITVNTSNGEKECNVIAAFTVDKKDYIALLPKSTDEIILVGYTELEDNYIELINIVDETEYNMVFNAFDLFMSETKESIDTV